MITQYCVREHAALNAQTQFLSKPSRNFDISTSAQIWASYVEFEGVDYIASLTNGAGHMSASRIYVPQPGHPCDTIYVAEDHLGIRQLLFCNSTEVPEVRKRPGIWWRTVSVPGGDHVLQGQTDGRKLRHLISMADTGPNASPILRWWATPRPAWKPLRFYTIQEPSEDAKRMTSLVCNGTQTTGYSSCWDGHIMISMRTHTPGEDLSFYNISARRPNSVWIYMPINDGERVTEVWQRRRGFGTEATLILITNKGWIGVMGAHTMPSQPSYYSFSILDKPGKGPSNIFFDESPHGIRELAFESPAPIANTRLRTLPESRSPCPESTYLEDYFYTWARLDHVKEVSLCRSTTGPRAIVIGLLLHYPEGRRASVGQVRLDCQEAPMRVEGSEGMWLGFNTLGFPRVDSIHFSRPSRAPDLVYLAIPWRGRLEWWFSHRQCKVYHDGQISPPTIC